MKLTATMLRKIIAEEVSKTKTKKTLSEAMTRGLDNMIAGIEDAHESSIFLLKQRISK